MQFKLVAVSAMPPFVKSLCVALINSFLRSGFVARDLRRALCLFQAKSAGGIRTLGLLDEVFKFTEEVFVKRLELQRRIHNLEDLLSVSNSAYTRGTSAVELSHDMKVCAEYSLRRALYFGLTIADHEIFLMLYNVLSMKLL